ncbi:MAG: putative metallophosphoesterase YhaO [Deltaproteobacteria bacterium ADurb.Bin135]|nr:MAG: putative metallophosphoesterase YhaO [Deltaproteobacteria bacterium ADurb.Bin135]
MKFLHTADWQIGMRAAKLGNSGERVREERLTSVKRIIEVAKSHKVEFILVAGDVFEDNAVDRVMIQKVSDILDSFNKPVFIIPGNHDPRVPGSVWDHPAWKASKNICIIKEEAPIKVPGGMLFPCPVSEKHSGRNPTAWIPTEPNNLIRIGMAHGTVEGIRQDEPDYPIPRDAAQKLGLDYLALGHWHSYASYPGPDGIPRMAYSGTHEPTKFGERESGNVLIVEITKPKAPPSIACIRTGGLDWVTIDREIRTQEELTSIREHIEALENPDSKLVEANLSGLLMVNEQTELDHIEQILHSRFLWGNLDISNLRPSPEDDTWIGNLPPGIIQDAAMKLRDNPGSSPEVSARALMELYAIVGEGIR